MRLTWRTRQSTWRKEILSTTTGDQKVEILKGLTRVDPRIRESNRSLGRIELPATFEADSILTSADMTRCDVLDVA